MELVLSFAGIIIFSLYDYFGFHISHKKGWENFRPVNPYRLSQFAVQLIISACLYLSAGWFSVFAFNFLWWTWWADLLFYFWYDVLRVFGYPRSPGGFKEQVMGNKVTWAYWTPWGLMRLKRKDIIMKKHEIFIQAILGLIIVLVLYYIVK